MKKGSSVKLSKAQDSVIKKDLRTKAELIKLLELTQHNLGKLTQMSIERTINPPVVIATDITHYVRGYEDGVKAEQEHNRKNKWFRFW